MVELDGSGVTPPLGTGLLPGVFRAVLLACGLVRERPAMPELRPARRAWLASGLKGWLEVRLVD